MGDMYNFLEPILTRPELHAKFLNTLSFLEYIGARKIFKSRDEKNVDYETLMHMSEEVRHALLFKRLSMKVDSKERAYDSEGVFCYEIARSYIGKLDSFCERLAGKDNCYGLVSYIIELRAVSFYRHYSTVGGLPLKSLLMEEERHLSEMEEKIRSTVPREVVRGALDFERELFDEFVEAIYEDLESSSVSSKSGEMSISMMSSSGKSAVSKNTACSSEASNS